MRVELLGGLRVRSGEQVVDRFQTRKVAALLARLAYYADRVHPREELIDLLWPEAEAGRGREGLRQAMSSLRRNLSACCDQPPGLFTADRAEVHVAVPALSTDVRDFEAALRRLRASAEVSERIRLLRIVVSLYPGDLLPGHYEAWVLSERERLREAYLDSLHRLGRALERIGRLNEATDVLSNLLAADDLRDRAYADLMRIETAAGRPQAALRRYKQLAAMLRREYGEAPGVEARELAALARRSAAASRPAPAVEEPPGSRTTGAASAPGGALTLLAVEWPTPADRDAALTGPAGEAAVRSGATCETDGAARAIFVLYGCARAASLADDIVAGHGARHVGGLPRAAIHTSETATRDSPLAGLAGRIVLGLLEAAAPGSVLASRAAASLMAEWPGPWQGRATDAGEYRLRDVPGPLRVYRVSVGAPRSGYAAAIQADPASGSRLPRRHGSFVGRDRTAVELAHMLAIGSTARLVVVTGPGGIGKTRLALETGARLEEEYRGAVWFAGLDQASDRSQVLGALGAAVRPESARGSNTIDEVLALVGSGPGLLIMDGAEGALDAVAPIVAELTGRAAGLRCLITSRIATGIPGERRVPLAPLATPSGQADTENLQDCESVRLFIDRARACRPDFDFTEKNAGVIAAICDRLEGIPLAIELAAARVQTLAPPRMLAQLERRLDFLVVGRRAADERHRALRATLEWSCELLTPALRRFWAALSVFRGGFSLEAAEAVCRRGEFAGAAIVDLLEALCSASLLSAAIDDEAARFDMLDTLREAAADHLPEADRTVLEDAHARWYADLAGAHSAQTSSHDPIEHLRALQPDIGNLRAAAASARSMGDRDLIARLSLGLHPLLYHLGHWTEDYETLDQALAAIDARPEPSPYRARVLVELAGLAMDLGHLQRAGVLASDAMGAFESSGDRSGWSDARNVTGTLALRSGNLDAAEGCFGDVLRSREDAHGRAVALHNLGRVAGLRGDTPRAVDRYRQALEERRRSGHQRGEAETLQNLGAIAHESGDLTEALTLYRECLDLYCDVGYRYGAAMILNNLGEIAEAVGARADAAGLYAHSARMLRELHAGHAAVPEAGLRRMADEGRSSDAGNANAGPAAIPWRKSVDRLVQRLDPTPSP